MSGGRWGYQSYKLEEVAGNVTAIVEMVARVEHHLDWGSCGDTCYGCAKQRAIEIFEAYFDQRDDNGEVDWREVDKAPYPYPCEHR